jgi:hypothetical protein
MSDQLHVPVALCPYPLSGKMVGPKDSSDVLEMRKSRVATSNGTPDSPSDYAVLSRLRRVVGYVLVVLEQENASG